MGAPMGNQNARKGSLKGTGKFLKRRRKLNSFVTKSKLSKSGNRTLYYSEFGKPARRVSNTLYAKKWESVNNASSWRKILNKKHGYN